MSEEIINSLREEVNALREEIAHEKALRESKKIIEEETDEQYFTRLNER